eukprot:Gregarina_sp_Pseudo_9__371@NODE_123_length_4124_cov_11_292044_g115_i0_p1_GENE_NODE_123_length_4124_cov_11_292044_g115_i0NODE_123_length_4124_cov_11_292044_g115_i0_p1_ORF_typecomplete_len1300_score320_30ABC_membrane/PF00664_23/5_1e50ABC_membrane/PF00664_23/5e50ABC_tran/PF00005_27/1_3e43ABC_tran/PF00005_27/8_6e41SMC_N/PF02463_19/84SMC_N/PF02463_19/1_8e05SMC_N/PF02463_19/2_1e02SMC_N/PF02463_19/1e06AAA_21/PF13304_6/1_7e05AAA_21/PF13304_6/0_00042AAA/PF00004_29/0_0013AAA/PF00004_29/3_5e05AAA_15/PF1317
MASEAAEKDSTSFTATSEPQTAATTPLKEDSFTLKLDQDENDKEAKSSFSFKLFRYGTKLDYFMITLSIVFNLGSGVLLPIFMAMFGDLFDSVAGSSEHGTNYYILWQVYLGCICFVLCFFGAALMEQAAERQLKQLKAGFLDSIMRQEMAWFDKYDPGKLSSTLNENCVVIRDALGIKFAQLFMFAGIFFGGYVTGLVRGWKMALVLSSSLPLLAIGGFLMMKVMAQAGDKSRGEYAQAGSLAEETFSTIRSIIAFGLESRVIQRYNVFLTKSYRIGAKGAIKLGASIGFTFFIMFLTYSLGFWYGGRLVVNEGFTGGKVLGVFFCVIMAAFSLGQAGPSVTALGKAAGAVDTMHKLVTRQSKIDPGNPEGHTQTTPLQGVISFNNVSFAYPSRRDKPVFRNLSLTIEAGKSVALVGASGCGKSTIIQLVERFYDPDGGQVLIDGRDIRDYNLKWLRQQIALVSQEPRLFATSITENIMAGREGAEFKDAEQAAKSANAHDFICGFTDKYDTYVGEAGSQLSGGQKQRIAIARAILRDPSILILDEATSALDNESEKIVQETLDKVVEQKARTTIIIAHRLTTVRKADKIIVLDNRGRGAEVAEQGTHEELMRIPNGLYAALVASQTIPGAEDEPVGDIADILEALDEDVPQREASILKLRSKFSKRLSRLSKDSDLSPEVRKAISKKGEKPKSRFGQVFQLMIPYSGIMALGLLGAVINGLIFPTFGIVFSKFMRAFYMPTPEEVTSECRKWALVFIGFAAGAFIGNFLQQAAFGWAGQKVVQRLRALTFENLIYQDVEYFDSPEHTTGKLSEILSADAVACRGWVGDNLGIYLQNIVAIIAAIVISFVASAKLAAVCLAAFSAMVPAMAIEATLLAGNSEGIVADEEKKDEDDTKNDPKKVTETTGYILNEVILNLRTVAAYTLEGHMNAKYSKLVNASYKKGKKKAWLLGAAWGFSQLMQYLVQALCLWYGSRLATKEGLSMEHMMQSIFALMMAAMGMGQSMIFLTDNNKARKAAERIYSIVERKPAIDSRDSSGLTVGDVKESIEFKNVRFRYPMRPDVLIYRDISFDIKEGQVVALVGASGCGKSTAVQLLERFYNARGDITIDGVAITEMNVRSLRSRIGLVNQEPVLFEVSVEENIALGKPDDTAAPADVENAAKMANAYEFIKAFPEGFQTNVGKLGGQLSGGQKQRIAIARALIRNPSILILDEATSALDAESERVVQEALDKLLQSQKRTTIVIAHRLSTIRNADKIVVMVNHNREGSRVAEVGTHDQLMEIPNGVYRGLVKIAHGK